MRRPWVKAACGGVLGVAVEHQGTHSEVCMQLWVSGGGWVALKRSPE